MRINLLAVLPFAAMSFQAFGATDAVTFSGSVQRDSAEATAFSLSVPAGAASKLVLADGSVLEFSAAPSQGTPAQSIVRLLDATGKQLHSQVIPGNAPASRSFRYTICGNRVTFASPPPAAQASCTAS